MEVWPETGVREDLHGDAEGILNFIKCWPKPVRQNLVTITEYCPEKAHDKY